MAKRNPVSESYVRDIAKIWQRKSSELTQLEALWPIVEEEIQHRKVRLEKQIDLNDPIMQKIDLLGPTNRCSDEHIHTQILTYLLNPNGAHGFEKRTLIDLLSQIEFSNPGAGDFLELVTAGNVSVAAEYRHIKEDRRCDIWIEIHSLDRSGLIVIENKIGAPAGAGQLKSYERIAKAKCKAMRDNGNRTLPPLLIYLAPDRRNINPSADGNWICLTYLELAAALRRTWTSTKDAWLSMYLSSILNGVLGVDPERLQDVSASDLAIYLGR